MQQQWSKTSRVAFQIAETWGIAFVALGFTSDQLTRFLQLVVRHSIASPCSQFIVFVVFVLSINFLIVWGTAYSCDLCGAVLNCFPDHNLELYQLRLTLQFDVFSAVYNTVACLIFASLSMVMGFLKFTLVLGAHPLICFWSTSICSVLFAIFSCTNIEQADESFDY